MNQNQVYTLTTPGTLPVLKAEAKLYVRVHSAVVADDALIDSMLDAVCYWGERYTGRSFRAQTWTMLQDSFGERIELRRSPLNAVTSVKHYVDGELAAVSADDYYLKKGRHWSEILLVDHGHARAGNRGHLHNCTVAGCEADRQRDPAPLPAHVREPRGLRPPLTLRHGAHGADVGCN